MCYQLSFPSNPGHHSKSDGHNVELFSGKINFLTTLWKIKSFNFQFFGNKRANTGVQNTHLYSYYPLCNRVLFVGIICSLGSLYGKHWFLMRWLSHCISHRTYVVYFDQNLGAVHFKPWLKYAFFMFFAKNIKSCKLIQN